MPVTKLRTAIFDIESDGLLDRITKVHILCITEFETGLKFKFLQHEIEKGLKLLQDADMVVAHNGLGFDIPALFKLYPWFEINGKIRDSLVMTRVMFSHQKELDFRLHERGVLPSEFIGKHSLDSWGYRIGKYKGDYSKKKLAEAKVLGITDEDELLDYVWGTYTEELGEYCENDVAVTVELWQMLLEQNYPEFPIVFEHEVADLMVRQEANGFPFNRAKALELEAELRSSKEKIVAECEINFPSRMEASSKTTYGKLREAYNEIDWDSIDNPELEDMVYEMLANYPQDKPTENITIPKRTLRYKDITRGDRTAGCPFTPVYFKEFNPGSRQQVASRLMEQGWEPQDFTEKGNIKIDDIILKNAAEAFPIASTLADYFGVNKTLGQLADGDNGWLKLVKDTDKIHHYVNPCGAVTGRATHAKPNLGQVPAISKDKDKKIKMGRDGGWGYECRSLFTTIPGFVMMGSDLSGIELRCLAHYMAEYDDGEYAHELLEGDIHTVNMNAAGLESRDQAKTFIYACVPMDTLALSVDGWKTYDDLQVGELILTYNQKTNVKEWKPVLEKVKYENAEIIEMSHNHGFKVRSTPNHRWFVNQRRERGHRQGRYMEAQVRTTEEINTESNIIVNAPMNETRDLSANFDNIDFNSIPKRETDWVKEVLKMNQKEMRAFLFGFLVADGHYQKKSKNSGGWNWCQNLGNIQEAALVASYICHHGFVHNSIRTDTVNPMMVAHINSKQHITAQRLVKTELSNDDVWCVRTENESWVIRQDNVITITGNTLYGAGPAKIGSIVLPFGSEADQTRIGKELLDRFMRNMPALKKLMKRLKNEARRGFINGVDGRRLYIRAQHAALNTLLQNAGAMIAKKWILLFEEYMEEKNYVHSWEGDFAMMAFVHDEIQVSVREALAKESGEISQKAAADAGDFFNFKLPVAAEYKIGLHWADTH